MHQAHCHCPACGAAAFELLEFGQRSGAAFESEIAGASAVGTCTQKLQGQSVAVVGGSFAGLMAARTLCRTGMTVKVFEARTQVGGRVLSDYDSFKVGKPLNEPYLGHIFFAGEHTQMDHFGYMEGALRSGERAAKLLMEQVCKQPEMVARVA